MRYNDLPEQCKRCNNLILLGIDRFGYCVVICMNDIAFPIKICDCHERINGVKHDTQRIND